jgi:hypothetical protein
VTEADICEHFHDGDGIHVDNARVVYHKDVNKVKMIFVDFKDATSLRNALCMEKDFRDRPVKVAVAESREPKRPERMNPLGGLSASERRQREREREPKRGERPERGLRPTAFDKDEEEPEWMAKRVQEAVNLESDANEPASPGKDVKVKKDEVKSNPFGNAKPRYGFIIVLTWPGTINTYHL